jgi:hypothetical protein
VEGELSQRGFSVTVPTLTDDVGGGPFWRQHAESVAETVAAAPEVSTLILVAHSGAGPLLPAIQQIGALPVSAYAFVDAGIPRDGASRLDLLDGEDPESAKQLRELLAAGRRFPEWTDDKSNRSFQTQSSVGGCWPNSNLEGPPFGRSPSLFLQDGRMCRVCIFS